MAGFDKSMEYVSSTQTLIGTQRKRLIDEDTGERYEVDQITKRALGQKQFRHLQKDRRRFGSVIRHRHQGNEKTSR